MNKIREIDFIKFIAMIMIVSGHAGVAVIKGIPPVHVGLFFMCSGFLLKEDLSFKDLLIRNIRKLYMPFIGFQIVFILFHNVLQKDGWIYTVPQHYYLVLEHTFLMDVTEPHLGPLWFLTALNLAIILWGGAKIIGKLLDTNKTLAPLYLEDILLIILMFIGINLTNNGVLCKYSFMNSQIINVSLVAGALINLGYKYHQIYSRLTKGIIYILSGVIGYACIVVLLKTNSFSPDVRSNQWGNLFIHFLALMITWHVFYVIGTYLMKINILYRLVRLIAENTLWIMALHMLALSAFRKLFSTPNGYVLVIWAMVFPIIIHQLYHTLYILIKRTMNKVHREDC